MVQLRRENQIGEPNDFVLEQFGYLRATNIIVVCYCTKWVSTPLVKRWNSYINDIHEKVFSNTTLFFYNLRTHNLTKTKFVWQE